MPRGKTKKTEKIAALEIRRMKLDDLIPAGYNPRQISDGAFEGLGKSVEEFGYVESIVFNKRSNTLVSGHQRLKVLIARGVEEVDVSVVDLDEAREKALNVTLNNPEIAGIFTSELRPLLATLRDVEIGSGLFGGLNLDVLLSGIRSEAEVDALDLENEEKQERPEVETTCPKCGFVFPKEKNDG